MNVATADRVVSGIVRRTGHGIARLDGVEQDRSGGRCNLKCARCRGDEGQTRSTKHEISGSGGGKTDQRARADRGGGRTGDWTNELVSRAAVVVVVGGAGGAVSEWSLLVQRCIHSFIHWESSLAPFTH